MTVFGEMFVAWMAFNVLIVAFMKGASVALYPDLTVEDMRRLMRRGL